MNKKRRQRSPDPSAEHWLVWVIQLFAALALLVPLYRSPAALSFAAFNHASLFQVCAQIVVAAWLILALQDRRYRPNWRHPALLAAAALLVLMLVSLLWSADPSLSFWGGRRRVMGTIHYLHYFLFFVALAATLGKSWPRWRRLLLVSNLACLVVGFWAIKQWLAADMGARVVSSIGNPTHLGAYVVLHVFIALLLLSSARTRAARLFYAASLLLHAGVTVIVAASRGSVVALLVGLLLAALFLVLRRATVSRRAKIAVAAAALLLVFAAAGTLTYFHSPAGAWGRERLPFFVSRMVYADLGQNRLQLWHIGWLGFTERPVLGWGLESYEMVFNRHYDPVRDTAVNDVWDDRAHNQYLEVALALGAVGLLAFLAFWGALFWSLWRRPTDDRLRLRPIITALLVTYLVNLFFFFDSPTITLLIWTLAAMAVGLTGGRSATETVAGAAARRPFSRPWPWLIVIALLAGQYWLNILPQIASAKNTEGYLQITKDTARAEKEYRASFGKWTYINDDLRLWLMNGLTAAHAITPSAWPRLHGLVALADRELARAAADHPQHYRLQVEAATAARWAAATDPGRLEAAESHARAALELAPKRPEAREELGHVTLIKEGPAQAKAVYEDALAYAKILNNTKGRLHYHLAMTEISLGDLDAAYEQITAAAQIYYPIYNHVRLALALAQAAPEGPADPRFLEVLENTRAAYPYEHPDILRAEAVARYKAGETAAALELIGRIEALDALAADLARQDLGLPGGD